MMSESRSLESFSVEKAASVTSNVPCVALGHNGLAEVRKVRFGFRVSLGVGFKASWVYRLCGLNPKP